MRGAEALALRCAGGRSAGRPGRHRARAAGALQARGVGCFRARGVESFRVLGAEHFQVRGAEWFPAHRAGRFRVRGAEWLRARHAERLPAPAGRLPARLAEDRSEHRAGGLLARGVAAERAHRVRVATRRDRRGVRARRRPVRPPRGDRGVRRCRRDACDRCARCRPSRPDPELSAARSPRRPRHPCAWSAGTPVRRLVRGSPPWDSAPTGRDLRALAHARADRHPPTNLAFRLCCRRRRARTSMTDFANDNDSATAGQPGERSNTPQSRLQFAVVR